MPKVSVGIVTYNSAADLPRCIEALREQVGVDLEITILDNQSEDGTVAWVREHVTEALLIVNKENVGFGKAHNQILQRCNLQVEDCYMPLNPDVILMPDYIVTLEAEIRKASAGWGTGKLRLLDEQGAMTGVIYSVGHAVRRDGYAFNIGYHQPDIGQFDTSRQVFGAAAAASLIRYALIKAVAPSGELFDSDMFMYFEDIDLDWRARLQGWTCWYCHDAIAYHRGSSPDQRLRADALANRYLGVLKNAYFPDLVLYNIPLMIAHCLARLVLTPPLGVRMIDHLLRKGRRMWVERQRPFVRRDVMSKWFQWSAAQPTGKPKSFPERLRELQRRQ